MEAAPLGRAGLAAEDHDMCCGPELRSSSTKETQVTSIADRLTEVGHLNGLLTALGQGVPL